MIEVNDGMNEIIETIIKINDLMFKINELMIEMTRAGYLFRCLCVGRQCARFLCPRLLCAQCPMS